MTLKVFPLLLSWNAVIVALSVSLLHVYWEERAMVMDKLFLSVWNEEESHGGSCSLETSCTSGPEIDQKIMDLGADTHDLLRKDSSKIDLYRRDGKRPSRWRVVSVVL